MEERIKGMEEVLQKTLLAAELEKQKADHHLNLLIEATREKKELLKQLIEMKEAERRWWDTTNPEQMEVVEEPPTTSPKRQLTAEEGEGEDQQQPSPKRIMLTEEELRTHPVR